jgi:hypothetical protein
MKMKFDGWFCTAIMPYIFFSLFFAGCGKPEELKTKKGQSEEFSKKNIGELNNTGNDINTIDEPVDLFIIKNPRYIDYYYEFEKLSTDEVLVYSYGNYAVNGGDIRCRLSAKNTKTDQERLLGYWDAAWGGFQISTDRKCGMFFLNVNEINCPLFFVDGNIGKVWYLMDVNLTARSTYDLKYLLYYIYESTDIPQRFILINLQNLEIMRVINWETAIHGGGLFRIFRSLDSDYDFRIDYILETDLYATGYYNIKNDIFTVVFDAELSYKKTKEREKITWEELGW